ncbi:MAG TPA: hypothetical protein VGP82_14715 [Ktedonobacterales bacterium]|nr:hypothetical protein [Ktedonobacterales bacterium]
MRATRPDHALGVGYVILPADLLSKVEGPHHHARMLAANQERGQEVAE